MKSYSQLKLLAGARLLLDATRCLIILSENALDFHVEI